MIYIENMTYYILSIIILGFILIIQIKHLIDIVYLFKGKWNEILGYLRRRIISE